MEISREKRPNVTIEKVGDINKIMPTVRGMDWSMMITGLELILEDLECKCHVVGIANKLCLFHLGLVTRLMNRKMNQPKKKEEAH